MMEEETKQKNIYKIIKAHCLGCSGGIYEELKNCPIETCELFPYRFGKNPYTKRNLTEEQKKATAERLKKAREEKKNQTC